MSRKSTGISEGLPRRGIAQGTGQSSRDPEERERVFRPNEGTQKALFIGGILLCALLLPILILNLSLSVKAVVQPERAPDVLGYIPLAVQTDSMYPTIPSGSLVIARIISPNDALAVGEDGDVVSFYSGSSVVTHRIVAEELSETGEKRYVTKGDLNPVPDMNTVAAEEIIGPVSLVVPGLGSAILFFQSPLGMLSVIAVLLLIAGVALVIHLIGTRNTKGGSKPAEAQEDVLSGGDTP